MGLFDFQYNDILNKSYSVNRVRYLNNNFIILMGTDIYVSSDGKNLTKKSTVLVYPTDITYFKGNYCISLNDGRIAISSDLVNWTYRGVAGRALVSICSNDNIMIATQVQQSMYSQNAYYSSDGITWSATSAFPDTSYDLRDTFWDGTRFIAIGSNVISTSTNGISWMHSASTSYGNLKSIGYNPNTKTCIVVGDAGKVFKSVNGGSWTAITVMPTTENHSSITYDKITDKFYIISYSSTMYRYICYVITDSPSGYNNRVLDSINQYNHVRYIITDGKSNYLVLGNNNIKYSNDTYTFTPVDKEFDVENKKNVMDIKKFNNKYFRVGTTGHIAYSDDGSAWTQCTQNTYETFKSIAYNGSNKYVAIGTGGVLATSVNGSSWYLFPSQYRFTNKLLNSVIWSGSQFVCVGESGFVASSSDGDTWVTRTSPTTNMLFSIAYDGVDYIAVGSNGAIYISNNLSTWTNKSVSTTIAFNKIVCKTGLYIAGGDSGQIYTSTNKATWTSRNVTSNYIYGGGSVNNKEYLILVGAKGTVLATKDAVNWNTYALQDNSFYIYSATENTDDKLILACVNGVIATNFSTAPQPVIGDRNAITYIKTVYTSSEQTNIVPKYAIRESTSFVNTLYSSNSHGIEVEKDSISFINMIESEATSTTIIENIGERESVSHISILNALASPQIEGTRESITYIRSVVSSSEQTNITPKYGYRESTSFINGVEAKSEQTNIVPKYATRESITYINQLHSKADDIGINANISNRESVSYLSKIYADVKLTRDIVINGYTFVEENQTNIFMKENNSITSIEENGSNSFINENSSITSTKENQTKEYVKW